MHNKICSLNKVTCSQNDIQSKYNQEKTNEITDNLQDI